MHKDISQITQIKSVFLSLKNSLVYLVYGFNVIVALVVFKWFLEQYSSKDNKNVSVINNAGEQTQYEYDMALILYL